MRRLSDTITRLRAGQPHVAGDGGGSSPRLAPLAVADNPGDLAAWSYVPDRGPDRTGPMPLVVVLHGCTQTAAGYDRGSGWSAMAERHGFAVLFPEQVTANNPNRCFNWFAAADVRRGSGEVASIRAMVAALVERHAIDPARVYATGLSAGGAMTSALLASYPDVFAGGAIVGGLPFGAADTVAQAFERMRGQGHADAVGYAAKVRGASGHRGAWPTVSVWHGDADATVAPGNAEAIVGQWLGVHGLGGTADVSDRIDGAAHRAWRDAAGRIVVEEYRIAGMGHGTPIATRGDRASGVAGAYMLDVGVSSTWHIAAGWDLLDPAAAVLEAATDTPPPRADAPPEWHAPAAAGGIQETIESALRQAGLMR